MQQPGDFSDAPQSHGQDLQPGAAQSTGDIFQDGQVARSRDPGGPGCQARPEGVPRAGVVKETPGRLPVIKAYAMIAMSIGLSPLPTPTKSTHSLV